MAKKALKTLEKERGILFTSDVDPDERYSDEEFTDLLNADTSAWIGVDHEGRTQFLKDNGYEVNRHNMLDGSLSIKPQE